MRVRVRGESRPGCDVIFVKDADRAEALEARAVVVQEVEAAVGTVRFWRGEDGLGGDGHG